MRDIQSPGRAQVWRWISSDVPIHPPPPLLHWDSVPAQTLAGLALAPQISMSSQLLHTSLFLPLFLLLIFPVFLISPKLRKSLGPTGPLASASWHLSVLCALG